MEKEFKITKERLQSLAKYQPKQFPKYTASLINLVNRWARGTASSVVGQMSDLAAECPYHDYDKWREWYLHKHPDAIDKSVRLIRTKLEEVQDAVGKIDNELIRTWVIDLVIDKSFWGLKIQEAILQELQNRTGKPCRRATSVEERKGIDGFVDGLPVQIKPSTYKTASNVRTEVLRAKTIYYRKDSNNDYIVDISEIADAFASP
jgi:hypothetical protein